MFNFFKKQFVDETIEEQLADLKKLPSSISNIAINGVDCDYLSSGEGEFGRTGTNPIPVNGPIGEIKYLNRLQSENGESFFYHRLKSIKLKETDNPIDVYELVSISGEFWDILYFDSYHPRRSRITPDGYLFKEFNQIISKLPIGLGSNNYDKDFPFGLPAIIEKKMIPGARPLAKKISEMITKKGEFIRPTKHKEKLSKIMISKEEKNEYKVAEYNEDNNNLKLNEKTPQLIFFNGKLFFDDRMFVFYLCPGEAKKTSDDLIATTIYHENPPKNHLWCLVTYWNNPRYPAFNVKRFKTKDDAIYYMKKVEPETPLISLGGHSPLKPLSYNDYILWKKDNNFKEYNYREMYMEATDNTENAEEVFLEKIN